MPRPASPAELRRSLLLLQDPGTPGWALSTDQGEHAGWVRLPALAEPAHWTAASARVAARLGGVERRAADSLLLMGLAARVWYVTVAPAVAGEAVLDPSCVLVTDDEGELRLGVGDATGWVGLDAAGMADLVVTVLTPLVEKVRLARGLAWGNVASALLGLRALVPGSTGIVVEALAHDALVGTTRRDGRRRSCCLFYRAGGGLCADCCLDRVPTAGPARQGGWANPPAGARDGAGPARR